MTPRVAFPDGKSFAFTVLDDTDDATVANTKPIYDLLHELGLRTTKTVWMVDCPEGSELYFAAETLASPRYLAWVRDLASQGFELAWHGATMESSTRERTHRALEEFRAEFGSYPTVYCNHGQNRENLYWGAKRYRSHVWAALAGLLRSGRSPVFEGEVEDSHYYWGDLCRQHFRYVRNFTFRELNLLRSDPRTPYQLQDTPAVAYWFSTADAPDANAFRRLVTPARLDRLCREGGVCILSTHFGKGFTSGGRVDLVVEETLRYLAALPGWFVPVSNVLDQLLAASSRRPQTSASLFLLEGRHVLGRLFERLAR